MITVLLLSPALDVTYLVPELTEGAIHRPTTVLRFAGGKGLNLARAATRLGGDVHVVTPLGGYAGAQVRELAERSGVDIVTVPTSGQTRACVTVSADDDGRLTEFYEPSADLSPLDVDAFVDAVAGLPPATNPGWTVLSGSIPTSVDVAVLVSLLHARAQRGERIAIDTHGDALAALIDGAPIDLVKVNRHEAETLLGSPPSAGAPRDALDLAARVRERCGATVIITDGSAGSAGVDASGRWRATSTAAPGRFPVGSGDTFLAGILVTLQSGGSIAEAMTVATAAAAANAAIPGAAEFELETVRSLRDHTTVTAL